MHTIQEKKLLMLKPQEIKISANQPRRTFDEYELKRLAESISANGIIQPLSVRKTDDGRYELIAGQRRLKAAHMVGLRRVPCILHKIDISTASLYALLENLQRSNLNFFEEAMGIEKLITVFGMSQSEVSAKLGIAQSTLSNKLRLLRLDSELREIITTASLTERQARALLRLPSEMRKSALDKIIADGMNLSQTESYIEECLNPAKKIIYKEPEPVEEKPIRKSSIGDVRLFSNSLTKLLDTLQNAGINASSRKYETDKYIEYKVRIKKEPPKSYGAEQLKIC